MVPGMFKPSAVKLTQAGQHGLTMIARPAAPGPPPAMMNHGVGGAFQGTAADRVTLGAEVVIAHPVLIGAKVVGRFLDQVGPMGLLPVELIQRVDHVGDLAAPQSIQLRFHPLLGGDGLFAVHGVGDGPEMFGRMRPVDDLLDARKVRVRDAL